ncbi:MAG TPA: hypothetical protein VN893_11595 [Bryobacteraceae bacterium]|nr:hypothetical protein [Bryobacteraceae bacterium]
MRDPQEQAYHDCMVECRQDGGKNCASQCTPKTGPTGDNSTPLDLCQIEYDTHPIGAQLLDWTIQQVHNSGGVTQDQCYSIAVGLGAAIGAAIAKVPFPWSLFGALAAADMGILGKCLCDKYYG